MCVGVCAEEASMAVCPLCLQITKYNILLSLLLYLK